MIVEIRDEVVSLSGALRSNRWRTLQSAVNVRLRHHPTGIIVDCGGLTALTPEGAETFRDAARHVAAGGGRMIIANLPPSLLMAIRQKPSLGSQLPIVPTVGEARASLGLEKPRRETRSAAEGSPVVAALLGTEADPHAVQVACRLGQSIYLAYLLVVPRNVPLLSPLSDAEAEARATLEGLEGAVRAAGRLAVPRVERTRDPGRRIIEVAAEVRAEALVLALPPDPEETLSGIAEAVLTRASCDVIIDRLPRAQKVLHVSPIAVPAAAAGRVRQRARQ